MTAHAHGALRDIVRMRHHAHDNRRQSGALERRSEVLKSPVQAPVSSVVAWNRFSISLLPVKDEFRAVYVLRDCAGGTCFISKYK